MSQGQNILQIGVAQKGLVHKREHVAATSSLGQSVHTGEHVRIIWVTNNLCMQKEFLRKLATGHPVT